MGRMVESPDLLGLFNDHFKAPIPYSNFRKYLDTPVNFFIL